MSRENVEIIQRLYSAFSRRDFVGALQYLDPEVEIHPALGGVMDVKRRYRGRDEVRQLFETISEGGAARVEPEEIVEIGGDRVLRVERWRPLGRQGIETEMEATHIYTFRDGLIVGIDGFRDRAEAVEAAGLQPSE